MAAAVPTGDPGTMTVSFLFGWQHVLAGLLVLIALAVVFVVVLAAGRGERAEWQAALAARSRAHEDVEPDEESSQPVG